MSYADEVLKKIRADIEKPRTTHPKPSRPKTNIRDLPGEQWKPIANYPGYYISNKARVASEKRGYRKILKSFRIISPGANQPHYRVTLVNNEIKRNWGVHILVAQAFCNKPDSDEPMTVSHIDANNDNNNAENLEWVTRRESKLRALTMYPRANVQYYEGLPLERHSARLGGNRSLVSNRIQKNGWCLECACTIPVRKKGRNMETCLHVEK